jgi:hypothetical protein
VTFKLKEIRHTGFVPNLCFEVLQPEKHVVTFVLDFDIEMKSNTLDEMASGNVQSTLKMDIGCVLEGESSRLSMELIASREKIADLELQLQSTKKLLEDYQHMHLNQSPLSDVNAPKFIEDTGIFYA